MDTIFTGNPPSEKGGETAKEGVGRKEKFIPSGAIAFFILLVLLCLVIWFGIYFLMLERI
jgi:hypothetical protein